MNDFKNLGNLNFKGFIPLWLFTNFTADYTADDDDKNFHRYLSIFTKNDFICKKNFQLLTLKTFYCCGEGENNLQHSEQTFKTSRVDSGTILDFKITSLTPMASCS